MSLRVIPLTIVTEAEFLLTPGLCRISEDYGELVTKILCASEMTY